MAAKTVRGKARVQVQAEREGTWTAAKRQDFFAHLAATLNVRASLRAVKMSAPGYYKLRKRDAGFRQKVSAVIADAYEGMELKYLERAVHGTKRPVFQGGVKVGHVVEYPDRVALTLLRAHRETAMQGRADELARKDEIKLAKLRLAERMSEMNRRMGGKG